VSSQQSLEVGAVAPAALTSLQGELGDGYECKVGAGEGENKCVHKNCRACVHMTVVHVGDAHRDRQAVALVTV
jgi:hypothetical protein